MPQFQLSNQHNGLFGEIYDTRAEAEAALDDVVREHLEAEKECIRLVDEREASLHNHKYVERPGAELAKLAEVCLRDFNTIEEVECVAFFTEADLNPVRLKCASCGGEAGSWMQWHNQDKGWGMCGDCAPRIKKTMSSDEFERIYGVQGIHLPRLETPDERL